MTAKKSCNWIDTFKGVAILLVILGHVHASGVVHDWIFLFHMPAFFFIGGLTFRAWRSPLAQFQRDAWRLLIPYTAFLLLIYPAIMAIRFAKNPDGGVALLADLLVRLVAGGPLLLGWVGVFWFITCLFLTKQVYCGLRTRLSLGLTGVAALLMSIAGLALSHFWPRFWLPWCADVVLVAVLFFWLGDFISDLRRNPRAGRVAAVAGIAVATVGLYGALHREAWTLNMKIGDYGVPILSLILAGGTVIALIEVAIVLDRIPGLSRFLRYCGQASLVIMFMHQPLQLILRDFLKVVDPTLRFGVALAGSLVFHDLMRRSTLGRAFYLGSTADQFRLFRRPTPEPQA